MNRVLLFAGLMLGAFHASAQMTVSGIVFDISKVNYVENVKVVSTGGGFVLTDSMGRYHILVHKEDSLYFFYNNKPTLKFAVSQIPDPNQFNISLSLAVKSKYSLLKEVTVIARSYREDSIENRETYSNVFNFTKPGLQSSMSPDGIPGADLGALINVFRFRYSKRMRKFRERLEAQEQEKYVDYRFNKTFVRRITGLQPPALDTFMAWYRPDYHFTREADELAFNQYILNSLYHFRKIRGGGAPPAKKE